MRRRLVLAMVGVALASVVLVGAGVLLLAQLGARSQAARDVEEQLEALTSVLEGNASLHSGLDRAQRALDLSQLTMVRVGPDGTVAELLGGPAGSSAGSGASTVLRLDADQLAAFRAGETVVLRGPGEQRGTVRGVRLLEATVRPRRGDAADGAIGLMASQPVVAVAAQARAWFVLSAAAVLAVSLVAAWGLSRRLVRPIHRIQQATAAIAQGDLRARVAVEGDDELADLGRSVNLMAAGLERSRAADQQFLLSVSHDLRTPLTAISGYAEALRDDAVDDPARAGSIIGDHAGRLERLVGDLLDLAKLEADRFTLHLQRLDVAVVVGRAVAGRAPVAERNQLQLRFHSEAPAPAHIDPDRLAQIVDNVIDNAITFAASTIEVVVEPVPGRVRISVADDGPGIAPDDLPHVFERLYVSAAQPARSENPSGLGLAIVRELTAAMGGSVTATSEPGAGTTITVELPLAS